MTAGPDLTSLLAFVGQLEAFGQVELAQSMRETVRRVEDAWAAWWNEPLTIPEAARWGGYSESQLRRHVHDHKLPLAPGGGIRRRHVPVQPGNELPLGLEPDAGGPREFLDTVMSRRATRRAS